MKAAQFWNTDNVSTFKLYDVNKQGEVELTDEEWCEILNEIWGEVSVCGMTFGQGDLLQDADPTAFRCGKGDYESELTSELESQLENEDDSDIEFIEDLDEDEEEDEE